MQEKEWIYCPICNSKTRIQIRKDTVLKNFPLFCPKCKVETQVNAENQKVSVIKK